MFLETDNLTQKEIYKILIAAVAPRPIAWAGTRSVDGVNNLAPFSFYNVFSSKPAIVGFSTIPKLDGRKKDTLQNIEDTGCFTLSTVSYNLLKQMSKSSALLEPKEDEFVYSGLTPAEGKAVNAPYVSEALLVFECKLQQVITFGNGDSGSGNLILGEITHVHIDDGIYQDGYVDIDTLDVVGRLAGNWYSTTRDKIEITRG